MGGGEAWTSLGSWISSSEEQLDAASQAILSKPALGLQDQASATANPMFGDERSTQQQQPVVDAAADKKMLSLSMELAHQAQPNDVVSCLLVT